MENNKREEIRTSPRFKSLKLAEKFNKQKLGGKGRVIEDPRTSSFCPGMIFSATWHVEYKLGDREDWIEKYEKYTKQQKAHCLGCNKKCVLKTVGGCPMFCGECYQLYKKEGKRLTEIREQKGWKPLES